jgi:hypothetical protein
MTPASNIRGRNAAWAPMWALAAAIGWGAHRDSLMTAMNCNYLEKLELGKR